MSSDLRMRGGCLATIRSYLPTMSPASKRIAETILRTPERALALSIVQIARLAKVNASTVTRFCRNIGFEGFHEFKSALRVDLLSGDHRFLEDIDINNDSVSDLVRKVFDLSIEGLRDTLYTLNMQELQRAAESILKADRVFCAPTGMASGAIVGLLEHKLLNLGILLTKLSNASLAPLYIQMLTPKDVVIAVSHSGASQAVYNFMEQCNEQGATTICITNYMDAPLVKVSDICLITAAGREAPIYGEPIGVRPTHATLVDALYVLLSILIYRQGARSEERGDSQTSI